MIPTDFASRSIAVKFGTMSKNLPPGTMPEVEGNPLPTIAQDLFGDGTMLFVPLPGYTIVHMGLLVRGQRDAAMPSG